MRTKKQNTRTPEKIKIDITRRTQSIEKETEKQWGKHKEKDTKETKIK